MIVKFSTSIGQLTMHGDAAVALLKGMGHSGTVPGAILAADLPDALARLQRMLETVRRLDRRPAATTAAIGRRGSGSANRSSR